MTTILRPPETNRLILPDDEGPPVEFDNLKPIAGANGWFEHNGQELRLEGALLASQWSDKLRPGQVLVHRLRQVPTHVVETGDRRETVAAHVEELLYRVSLRPLGTAAKVAGQAQGRRKAPKPYRAAIVDPPPLGARREQIRAIGQGRAAISAPQPPTRGRAVLAWLSKQDVAMGLIGEHLAVSTRGGSVSPVVADVVRTYGPLLRGWVAGQPLTCARCQAEAVTVALLDVPLCETHASATTFEAE